MFGKINGVYLSGILAGQKFVILISGVCLIRIPDGKKFQKIRSILGLIFATEDIFTSDKTEV